MNGIGANLFYLMGGSKESSDKYAGRKITAARSSDEGLELVFTDGVKVRVRDDGQSCCEHRYMRSDDDVEKLVGQTLQDIRTRAAKPEEEIPDGEYGDAHEIVFLEVVTKESGVAWVASFHNEHNGYYGGFGMSLEEVTP